MVEDRQHFYRLLRYPTDYPPGLFHSSHDKLRRYRKRDSQFILIWKFIFQNLINPIFKNLDNKLSVNALLINVPYCVNINPLWDATCLEYILI